MAGKNFGSRLSLLLPVELEGTLRERSKGYESFSDYLRYLLEKNSDDEQFKETVINSILDIGEKIDSMSVSDANNNQSALIEVLLLLRFIAKPDVLNKVSAEMSRLGISQVEV
ncbi:hypothetical protein AB0001_004771 [Salmonella enterica]|nr:hypothetical protein [Salmonella enterica]EEP3373007.1 hypothetical protein [Salmonella enterica]EFP6579714.1 hypothetical protein [Salmonella enterica]EGC7970997.1 hypothetical protein [Salmonella enterica]EIV4461174.1 hypothetical protein [Salmonella enterica]